jgi:hypothetical protein
MFVFDSPYITITPTTYTSLTTVLKGQFTGITCTTGSNCVYSGPCSDLKGHVSNIVIEFGDGIPYTIPVQSFLLDSTTSGTCSVMLISGTGSSVILGTPWFKTFYTVFDLNNMQISMALATNSYGAMS